MLRMYYHLLRKLVRNYHLNYKYSKENGANVKGNSFRVRSFHNSRIEFGECANVVNNTIGGNVKIGPHASIYDSSLTASRGNKIDIGSYTLIQGGQSQIRSKHKDIILGSFCTIGYGAAIVSYSHRIDTYTTSFLDKRLYGRGSKNSISFGQIEIGHDCMIGLYSFIGPRVRLGNGCIVLPNSVVKSSFDAYSIIAGNPAVKIGSRFSEKQIDYLKELNWYEWENKKIVGNLDMLIQRVNAKKSFSDL